MEEDVDGCEGVRGEVSGWDRYWFSHLP